MDDMVLILLAAAWADGRGPDDPIRIWPHLIDSWTLGAWVAPVMN